MTLLDLFAFTAYLLGIVLVLTIFYLFRANNNKQLEKLFPGPKTLPLLGNSLDFLRGGNASFRKLQRYIAQYDNKPFRLWIGSELFVVLSDAEDIRVVLNNSVSKPRVLSTLNDVHGPCLFSTLDAENVKNRRKRLTPAFNSNCLMKYSTIISEAAKSILEILGEHCNTKRPFNVHNIFSHLSFDITARTMMGIEVDKDLIKNEKYFELNKRAVNFATMRALSSLTQFTALDKLFTKNISNHLRRNLHIFAEKFLKTKFNHLEETYDRQDDTFSVEDDVAHFLQAAYKLYLEKNNSDIFYCEMLAIAGAGTDTSSNSISFILLMLSIHQHIQDKVYQELCEIFADSNREITVTDVERMFYTEQVIKECLRHLNLIPFIFRYTERELKIRNVIIPADTNVMLLLFNVHCNPEYYPEPDTFNPDNFSPEAVSSRPTYSFIPFANGARDCIGKKFAIMKMKIILAIIIRRFKFSTKIKKEDVKLDRNYLTSVTNNDYSLLIDERTVVNQ